MKKLLTAFAVASIGLGTFAATAANADTVVRRTTVHRYHHKTAHRVCSTTWRHHKRVRTCRTVWR